MTLFTASPNHGFDIAAVFGTPSYVISEAKKKGVGIMCPTPGEFAIYVGKGVSKEVVSKFSVQAKVISFAKTGQLGPSSKEGIEDKFTSGLKKAIKLADSKASSLGPAVVDTDLESYSKADIEVTSQLLDFAKLANYPAPASGGFTSLANAETIGDFVGGTTPGSKYVYFAKHQSGVKFALRIQGQKLSIRAEGPASGIAMIGIPLKEALNFDNNGTYMSVHFNCPKPYLVQKALGAMVGVLGYSAFKEMVSFDAAISKSKGG